MKFKLKNKEVEAIWWTNQEEQENAIKILKELGCTDVKVINSGAGIGIDFRYPTIEKLYHGSLFYGNILVFKKAEVYPEIYSKKDFEELFEPSTNTNLKFGEALEAVKEGKLIARGGWNGKGMFVFMRPSDSLDVDTIINKVKSLPKSLKDYYVAKYAHSIKEENEGDSPKYHMVNFTAYLCLKAADDSIVNGWTPNTLDMLANDWGILD